MTWTIPQSEQNWLSCEAFCVYAICIRQCFCFCFIRVPIYHLNRNFALIPTQSTVSKSNQNWLRYNTFDNTIISYLYLFGSSLHCLLWHLPLFLQLQTNTIGSITYPHTIGCVLKGLTHCIPSLPSVAMARLGSALGATQGVSHTATAQLWLEPAPEQLSPAKFGNNCLRLCLDLATHNSTSTATQGIYGGQ